MRANQICNSVLDAVGYTPAVRLSRLFAPFAGAEIVAKLEYLNPSGSIKDRMVKHMLQKAKESGQLESKHVVESSSGNTGAALAMACAVLKLKCDIAVPDTTSNEKIRRIGAYGANVHTCQSALPPSHTDSYYAKAIDIAETFGAFHLDQYRSEVNSDAH
jgi:cystathionine beta-synthase